MMAESEPDFYDRAIRRISRLIWILGLIGTVAAASLRGIRDGLAFLIGASLSYASFWGWQQIAHAITPGRKPRSSPFFVFRILAIVALAYVIIRFLGLNAAVAVAGLLVSAAAVLLEIIYELIYART
jgi:hypothetical protein